MIPDIKAGKSTLVRSKGLQHVYGFMKNSYSEQAFDTEKKIPMYLRNLPIDWDMHAKVLLSIVEYGKKLANSTA